MTLPRIRTSFSSDSDFSLLKTGGFPKPTWDNMVHLEKPAFQPFHPGLFLPSHAFKWSWAYSVSISLRIKAGSRAHTHFPGRSSLSLLSSQIPCHFMLLHLAFSLNKLFCRSLHICREKSALFLLLAQQFEASMWSFKYIKEVGTVTHQA